MESQFILIIVCLRKCKVLSSMKYNSIAMNFSLLFFSSIISSIDVWAHEMSDAIQKYHLVYIIFPLHSSAESNIINHDIIFNRTIWNHSGITVTSSGCRRTLFFWLVTRTVRRTNRRENIVANREEMLMYASAVLFKLNQVRSKNVQLI